MSKEIEGERWSDDDRKQPQSMRRLKMFQWLPSQKYLDIVFKDVVNILSFHFSFGFLNISDAFVRAKCGNPSSFVNIWYTLKLLFYTNGISLQNNSDLSRSRLVLVWRNELVDCYQQSI